MFLWDIFSNDSQRRIIFHYVTKKLIKLQIFHILPLLNQIGYCQIGMVRVLFWGGDVLLLIYQIIVYELSWLSCPDFFYKCPGTLIFDGKIISSQFGILLFIYVKSSWRPDYVSLIYYFNSVSP